MSLLITDILAGRQPESAKQHKEWVDHCEHIIADCEDTMADIELPDLDKANYRQLRRAAQGALQTLKRIQA